MTVNINANGLRTILDQGPPNALPDAFRAIQLGLTLRSNKTFLRLQNPNTAPVSPYQLATVQTIALPDDAKACTILRATARTGTAAAGELTVAAYGATPTTRQVAVAPNGDLVFLATDAFTNVDIVYEPERCDVVELTLPVVPGTGVLTIPARYVTQGAVLLEEAQILAVSAGTLAGTNCVVLVPAATQAVTKQACMNLAKSQVLFNAGDNVTQARVKFAMVSAIDINALLQGNSPIL